jgi:hypothetical protein
VHDLQLHRAGPADRPVLERLWSMFRHDLSAFGVTIEQRLPRIDGTFRNG